MMSYAAVSSYSRLISAAANDQIRRVTPSLWLPVAGLDGNLRLVQPSPAALRTLARLRQLVFTERKPTRPAFSRHDDDPMAGGSRGAEKVLKIVRDVAAVQPQ